MKVATILKTYWFINLFFFAVSFAQFEQDWREEYPPSWAYDPGPNPDDPMLKELIDLHADIPFYGEQSEEISSYRADRKGVVGPYQKFRTTFGPIPWRMPLQENSVAILFIGQDGTHIAEAAARPATAGFGGRAQDLAAHFGIEYSAAFINTYAFTIFGQYAVNNSPYVYDNQFRFSPIVPNDVWLYSQHPESSISKWRNKMIDWIIRRNKDSLKLIVLFGTPAKDSIATFIESIGGKVGYLRTSQAEMKKIQMPYLIPVNAGGNNEAPMLLNASGEGVLEELLDKKIDYAKDQNLIMEFLKDQKNFKKTQEAMVFTKAGPYSNGLIHPAQIGGYDLDKIEVKGKRTLSIKGLKLSDGDVIKNDILVVPLRHPTWLSSKQKEYETSFKKEGKSHDEAVKAANEKVSAHIREELVKLEPYRDEQQWIIKADPNNQNKFDQGIPYLYGRADIHNVYYDFGAPLNRQVSVSDALRLDFQSIVIGDRRAPSYDPKILSKIKKQAPNEAVDENQMFVSRARTEETRYVFDPGPTLEYAKLFKSLDYQKLYARKDTSVTKKDETIENYYIKSHPEVGDFGHYRGTFKNPKAIVIADPDGFDDLITARALTGTRGQYLQGLLNDMGIKDQYLLIKTVPFGMDGASPKDWSYVLTATAKYREDIFNKIILDYKPEVVITDGTHAMFAVEGFAFSAPMVHIVRASDSSSGLEDAAKVIKTMKVNGKKKYSKISTAPHMANIPASHLTYYARVWEGTSGDRVLNATGAKAGSVFIEVAPSWVAKQKPVSSEMTQKEIRTLLDLLDEYGFPKPEESITEYLERKKKEDKKAA